MSKVPTVYIPTLSKVFPTVYIIRPVFGIFPVFHLLQIWHCYLWRCIFLFILYQVKCCFILFIVFLLLPACPEYGVSWQLVINFFSELPLYTVTSQLSSWFVLRSFQWWYFTPVKPIVSYCWTKMHLHLFPQFFYKQISHEETCNQGLFFSSYYTFGGIFCQPCDIKSLIFLTTHIYVFN